MPQRPELLESLSGQTACGRHPQRKEAWRPAPVDFEFGFSVTSLRGDRSNPVNSSPPTKMTCNHDFWFLTSVIGFPPTTPAYPGRLALIVDFYHLLLRLFSSEAFDNEPIESVPM